LGWSLFVPEKREQPLRPIERGKHRLRRLPSPIRDRQLPADERSPLTLQRDERHVVHAEVLPKGRASKQPGSTGRPTVSTLAVARDTTARRGETLPRCASRTLTL